MNEFFRIAVGSPLVKVADGEANAIDILAFLGEVAAEQPDLVVLPEMALTAYTCADLFHNATLLEGAVAALKRLVDECPEGLPLVLVGMPVRVNGALYNCAVGISRGRIHGIIPKSFLPNYNEFYERRWFAPASHLIMPCEVELLPGIVAPMSADLLFDLGGVKIGAEICEDLWVPVPPSCRMAMNGAEVIANLSASDDVVGKYAYLSSLVEQQSARCICGYAYASAGFGESSTDLVFSAKGFICENGHTLASYRGPREALGVNGQASFAIADVDISAIRRDRLHMTTFADCASQFKEAPFVVKVPDVKPRETSPSTLLRYVDPHPFVPSDTNGRTARCEEILSIQHAALAKRLHATGCKALVVGISGGLDSTLALLVAVRAFDALGLDRKGITGITMPGFGTTGRTRGNALSLMRELGVTIREIPIGEAVALHFRDIGHDPTVTDVTYENSQARERTQILMDVANQVGGMVLGTGDLSELALGWATYNGDHMSMYAVNAGVPKTLVRHLVKYVADEMPDGACRQALLDVCDTPVSPELIPPDSEGNIAQKTDDLVGPYELHDFFLYHMLRHGESPRRIYLLARKAFAGTCYDDATILRWLKVFVRRFFAQQFKRSCMPDGPKVGSVTLSPRGDWRMPSDASAALWLAEADTLQV